MENSLPATALTGALGDHVLARREVSPGREISLLLVSRSPSWSEAVHGATMTLGGGEVFTCDARGALARLAGTSAHYSHLLVDRNDAEGLLDELADLAVEVAAPDTDMLVLGPAVTRHPHVRAIPAATPGIVAEALMASPPARGGRGMELAELRSALGSAMIDARYQPIVRIADRQPVGLEALARLNHPRHGTVLPDRFVPQLEDAGLAAELARLVCARAFADLAGPLLANRGLRMSINFPLDVLLHPAAINRLEEERVHSGVAADRIIVELTESQPVEDIRKLGRSLERLQTMGYGAAIDDVGPAMPRLASLLDLPFTSLKLDKGMVQRVVSSDQARAFVADTIVKAKARGWDVVAEGVETDAVWHELRELGADHVQGYFVARPLPVAAVPIWWDAWEAQAAALA